MSKLKELKGWQILTIYAICVILLAVPLNEVIAHEEPCVYVTKTGDCYHSKSCHYLYSSRAIGIEVAKGKGYRACSQCGGRSVGTIRVHNTAVAVLVSFMVVSGVMLCIVLNKEKGKRRKNEYIRD